MKKNAHDARVVVTDFGPIPRADVTFGDLNVSVGSQATGKSLLFQLLKLLVDADTICHDFLRFSADWGEDFSGFMRLYFGTGMAQLIGKATTIEFNGKPVDVEGMVRKAKRVAAKSPTADSPPEKLFYIPAQRVMAIQDGLTRTFDSFRGGDPYVLRQFAQTLHRLVQTEFSTTASDTLFPKANRLNGSLRKLVSESFFHGFDLKVARDSEFTKRLVLEKDGTQFPFLSWSAGQREFTPLLLGLYWLLPAGAVSKRDSLDHVVIEEPEMGLHPKAIQAFMAIVLELMRRGYKVFLSTHSPAVLDVVWGLKTIQQHHGEAEDVMDMLGLPAALQEMAEKALHKRITVSYFETGKDVADISRLDLGAEDSAEAGWGGLTSFSGKVGDVVARVVNRDEARGLRK